VLEVPSPKTELCLRVISVGICFVSV